MSKQKVCRLCLGKPSSVYFSIFENNIANMFESLTSNKVSPSDEISTIICLKCLLTLRLTYNFLQRIKKSEQHLINVKIEEEPAKPDTNCDLVKLCDLSCIICGDNSTNDHIREHFSGKQKCGSCDETFTDFRTYRQHLGEHPKILFTCGKCKAKFRYKSFYELHVKNVCSGTNRIVSLGLQSKQAISLLSEHSNKRKFPKALRNVDNEGTRKQVFKLGLRSSEAIKVLVGGNEEDKGRICNICFKRFTKKSFQGHSHETKTCHICNKEVSKYGYRKHSEGHTLGPQICHLCGATLQNKNSLMTHIFYSHNDSRYKCDECGKVFQKKHIRDLHIQKEHIGQPTFYCDTCGKGFFTRRFLDKHIKMRHLKLRPHNCEFCQKGFSSQYALKTHRRQHTNETPYRCEVCGEGFRQNVTLRAHRKSKHGIVEENICNCKVCGKGFASDSALYAHMRLH